MSLIASVISGDLSVCQTVSSGTVEDMIEIHGGLKNGALWPQKPYGPLCIFLHEGFPLLGSFGSHLRPISQLVPQLLFRITNLKSILLKLPPHFLVSIGWYKPPSFSASTQRDLTITVGYRNSTDGNDICKFYAGPMASEETRRFTCDNPTVGRFVFVQRTGDAITIALALCEVKVFGNGK